MNVEGEMQTLNQREDDQCEIYIRWLNEQLSKRPEARVVRDMRRDLRDGVAFIQLIEVVAGERLPVIHTPRSQAEMRDNVSSVLLFMNRRRIRMHHTNPRDIIIGNLKATMRLVLSLAVHFKATKQRKITNQSSGDSEIMPATNDPNHEFQLRRVPSATSLVADAAFEFANANEAAHAGLPLRYNKLRQTSSHSPTSSKPSRILQRTDLMSVSLNSGNGSCSRSGSSSSSGTSNGSTVVRTRPHSKQWQHNGSTNETESDCSSLSESSPLPVRYERNGISHRPVVVVVDASDVSPPHATLAAAATTTVEDDDDDGIAAELEFIRCLEDRRTLLDEIKNTRSTILQLQGVLLDGTAARDEENLDGARQSGDYSREELIITRARLAQSDKNRDDIKHELSTCKEECLNLQVEKIGLLQRLNTQEETIVDLRGRLLRHEVDKNREQLVNGWMSHRDDEVVNLRDDVKSQNDIINRQKQEVQRLHQEMINRDKTETNLFMRLQAKDQLVKVLREQVGQLSRQLELDLAQLSLSDNASDSAKRKTPVSVVDAVRQKEDCIISDRATMSAIYASQDSLIL